MALRILLLSFYVFSWDQLYLQKYIEDHIQIMNIWSWEIIYSHASISVMSRRNNVNISSLRNYAKHTLYLILKLNLHVYNTDIFLKLNIKITSELHRLMIFNSFIFGRETKDWVEIVGNHNLPVLSSLDVTYLKLIDSMTLS